MTASDIKNIYNEARLLLRVPHPNIIRVRDVFKAKGDIGTTFEFIKGGKQGNNLKEIFEKGGPMNET
jgi:serine/threonine protein kinase